jgi:hypothetical protein
MIFEDDPELTLLVRLLRNSMAGKTAEDSLWSSRYSDATATATTVCCWND